MIKHAVALYLFVVPLLMNACHITDKIFKHSISNVAYGRKTSITLIYRQNSFASADAFIQKYPELFCSDENSKRELIVKDCRITALTKAFADCCNELKIDTLHMMDGRICNIECLPVRKTVIQNASTFKNHTITAISEQAYEQIRTPHNYKLVLGADSIDADTHQKLMAASQEQYTLTNRMKNISYPFIFELNFLLATSAKEFFLLLNGYATYHASNSIAQWGLFMQSFACILFALRPCLKEFNTELQQLLQEHYQNKIKPYKFNKVTIL